MKYALFIFVLILSVVIYLNQTRREHMKSTCTRPVFGPQSETKFPEIYGPGMDGSLYGPGFKPQKSSTGYESVEDDGKFESSTATRNQAYVKIFNFANPGLQLAFPSAEGPPEPYLNDFSSFHR